MVRPGVPLARPNGRTAVRPYTKRHPTPSESQAKIGGGSADPPLWIHRRLGSLSQVGGTPPYFTWTLIFLGLASACLGRWIVSTPFSRWALIPA